MVLHQYYCSSCDSEKSIYFESISTTGKYVDLDAGYNQVILVSSLSEEEIRNLPMDKDPRDYEVYKKVFWQEIPLELPCEDCGCIISKQLPKNLEGWVKGNCFTNRERERKFYQKGYDKQQAHRFYDESIQASKERIADGRQHYKKVDMDVNHYAKHGMVKPVKNKAKKVEAIHKLNAELVKPLDKK